MFHKKSEHEQNIIIYYEYIQKRKITFRTIALNLVIFELKIVEQFYWKYTYCRHSLFSFKLFS